jgi:exosome complex component RRP40
LLRLWTPTILYSLCYAISSSATFEFHLHLFLGDVVYAKIVTASKDMEAELVCVDAYGKKSGLGQLENGGFLFSVPLHLVRKMLSPESVLLKKLGQTLKFEIAVGMNGRIWVRTTHPKDTICIANAIWAAEHMTNSEITAMVSKLADALAGF